ncbi:MAG: PD-(D/E)XK nuclease family protein [Treponema sp.]|jgi:CRISPR/Cas system-associated exonuclease Cas4 (RecB family)|nr:PD-(D/E)XK nuclease family protein [Treponema sp.]
MNHVETALINNIDTPGTIFVFPTDIAVSRWASRLLCLKGGTIAMNKFIAWDKFKQSAIKSKVKDKKSIPSSLRKIFVSRLIAENCEAASQKKELVFSSLIQEQWALESAHFVSWITKILPALGTWFNKKTKLSIDKILNAQIDEITSKFEDDDRDLYVLARRYALFLQEHSLFEPAWETPPFNSDGLNCFIFFPQSLSDFCEYRELLTASNNVKIIGASNTSPKSSDAFFYTNSRSEITEAALYIRALHEKQGIDWESIVVCIPDIENYEPYVIREFNNRNIPFVKRMGKSLNDYPAGSFFRSVLDCISQDFSFASVVSLICNKNLPWKDGETIDKLIEFGMDNNCLYSWNEQKDGKNLHINVWEDAFSAPKNNFDKTVHSFFNELKKCISSFRFANSFAELRRRYFIFRERFFDMEKCTEETGLVLSRCICELMNLVELEKSFPNVPVMDPFLFLTEFLNEVYYLPQTKISGVSILPYKTAAAAPFDCHIILGAGQESMSVIYSHLDFLPRKKREELGLIDEDASTAFINMHKYNSVKISAFFCCESTFSGYAVPHSKLKFPAKPKDRYAQDPEFSEKFSTDNYKEESLFFLSDSEPQKIHQNQKIGFTEWEKRRRFTPSKNQDTWKTSKEIQKNINVSFAKTGKYSVSATSLREYFQCSLKWFFERVLSIKNTQIETSLLAENMAGLVYHAVLNDFFSALKNKGALLLEPEQEEFGISLPVSYIALLEQSVNKIFDNFSQMSALTSRLLRAGKKDYLYNLEKFLAHFLSVFAGCTVTGSESFYSKDRGSYIMRGTVDCILKDKEGKYIIIDFKLKNLPKRAEVEDEDELADFQLPMYITLAEENENIKVYSVLFYSILNLKSEIFERQWYDNILKEFNNKTEQFVKEISSGNLGVFAKNYHDCINCDYQRICRTGYVIQLNTGNKAF